MIAPAVALAHLEPAHLDALTERELVAAVFDLSMWLRPDQRVPPGDWRSCGFVAGRGWGKSLGIGVEINRRVLAGELRPPSSANDGIALMAPTDERIRDVQVKTLVETSPPWFRAEPYYGGVRWPNGVRALPFTPEAPGRTRSGNFELAWLTELVAWNPSTRVEAHHNITTATRVGARPQVLWDTTSRGKNDVILARLAAHDTDPAAHRLIRGTMFDNPFLSDRYLRDEVRKYGPGSRAYDEEILGLVFSEAAGALWLQAWIDSHRVAEAPPLEVVIVAVDPAIATGPENDESGIVVAGRDAAGDVFVLEDASERHTPAQWSDVVVGWCLRGAAGVVLERNRGGDLVVETIRARAKERGLRVELLPPTTPFPRRAPGVIYVREVHAAAAKAHRASGPSVLYSQGRVHHVGVHGRLELEMTTWEPGSRKSPNRIDALAYAVTELGALALDARPPPDMAGAKEAARQLRERLRAHGGGRGGRLGI